MLVIAGLWVVVFIPSWFQNRVDRAHNRQGATELREQVKQIKSSTNPSASKLMQLADRGRRLTRTRNTMTVMAILTLSGAVTSAFFASQFPPLFVATGIGSLVGMFMLLVALRAAAELRKLLVQIARSRTEISANLAAGWQEPALSSQRLATNPRTWTPNPLPSPVYRSQIGELEIPNIASVTEIDQKGKNFDTQEEINEILRRRRASA